MTTTQLRADRRRTGGERPATRRQELTRNNTRRQGQRPDRSIAAGQEMAMLVFTRQLSKASMWHSFSPSSEEEPMSSEIPGERPSDFSQSRPPDGAGYGAAA